LLPLLLAAAVHPSAALPHTTQNRFASATLVSRIHIEHYFGLKNALTTTELNLGNCVAVCDTPPWLRETKLSEPKTGFKRSMGRVLLYRFPVAPHPPQAFLLCVLSSCVTRNKKKIEVSNRNISPLPRYTLGHFHHPTIACEGVHALQQRQLACRNQTNVSL
jgi:hypothetical protein